MVAIEVGGCFRAAVKSWCGICGAVIVPGQVVIMLRPPRDEVPRWRRSFLRVCGNCRAGMETEAACGDGWTKARADTVKWWVL